jgi:hypothetical protein
MDLYRAGVTMSLTEKQTQLASFLDTHVQRITANEEVDDLTLLVAMSDYMDSFKQLYGFLHSGGNGFALRALPRLLSLWQGAGTVS